MDTLFAALIGSSFVLFAAATVMSVIRIIRGPSVVDRMVGSDTFATIVICVLCADMALRGHTTTLPLVLALAITASIGTLAVARFVSRGRAGNMLSTGTHDDEPDVDDVTQHRGDDGTSAAERVSRQQAAHSAVAKEVRNER